MPDEHALRAYRSEIERLRGNAEFSIDAIRKHLAAAERWLSGDSRALPPLTVLAADAAGLCEAVAALKALQEADYLTEGN